MFINSSMFLKIVSKLSEARATSTSNYVVYIFLTNMGHSTAFIFSS